MDCNDKLYLGRYKISAPLPKAYFLGDVQLTIQKFGLEAQAQEWLEEHFGSATLMEASEKTDFTEFKEYIDEVAAQMKND